MEDNSYGLSSSDNEPTDTNLLIVLLRTVYVLFQNSCDTFRSRRFRVWIRFGAGSESIDDGLREFIT